jgi:hypothetical protein
MRFNNKKLWFWFTTIILISIFSDVFAKTLYVNSGNGCDTNPGTQEQPLKTLDQAALLVNNKSDGTGATIKIAAGIYSLEKTVVFENRSFSEKERLIIEAVILPDDPNWKPESMPVLVSIQDSRRQNEPAKLTETYSIKIKTSHVTIRGLKFFGNPLLNNWHCCVERVGENLDDLLIKQCVFAGSEDAFNIYCATLATGDRFVLENNIFYNCDTAVVFWDGPKQIPGKANAMRNCIIYDSKMSGVWTCQTAEDFNFSNNIVCNSEYFWLRKKGDCQKYHLYNCIVTGNKFYSGYGIETGPTGRSGNEVVFEEKNIIKKGKVLLDKNKSSRNYLHPLPGTLDSNLNAGLFTNCKE